MINNFRVCSIPAYDELLEYFLTEVLLPYGDISGDHESWEDLLTAASNDQSTVEVFAPGPGTNMMVPQDFKIATSTLRPLNNILILKIGPVWTVPRSIHVTKIRSFWRLHFYRWQLAKKTNDAGEAEFTEAGIFALVL